MAAQGEEQASKEVAGMWPKPRTFLQGAPLLQAFGLSSAADLAVWAKRAKKSHNRTGDSEALDPQGSMGDDSSSDGDDELFMGE